MKSRKLKKKKQEKTKIVKIRFCPKCQGKEIVMVAGGNIGLFKCVDCGFTSSIFPEREFKVKDKKIIR